MRNSLRQLFTLFSSLFLLIRAYEQRSITTSWGVVRGEVVETETTDLPQVAQYLGIPYGVSPSGQYRFNMAISAAKWTHMPKDARKLSNVCIQTDLPELSETKGFKHMSAQRYDHVHKLLPKLKQQSEDCLFMNIFVPERLEISQRENPIPVVVLVHGDDYGWNAGNPYNGTILAAHGQIIVVTLNYRLGVFGFLGRCESSSCSGNSGISDLVSALTMLNVILPSFGGDPKSVTLLGWGSGASLVSLLMASPLTQPGRRLFHRAILLDGTALSPWAMTNNPQPYFMQLAEHMGCSHARNRSMSFGEGVDTLVRCMQDHSADNVTRALHKIEVPTFLSAFAPIVDGQLIPNRPRVSFSAEYGSLFREIDLMVGLSSNPAHHLLSNDDLLKGISKERREKIFRTLVRNLYEYHRSEVYAAIINEYTDWDNPKDHPKSLRNGVLDALSDALFTAPLIETLRMHSSDEMRKEANTFMFVFAHETRQWMSEQPNSGVHGSLSGDHLPYILGYPLIRTNKEEKLYNGFNADDRGISEVMMHYVANFVKSGDPSKPLQMSRDFPMGEKYQATAWQEFNQANREAYLEIKDQPRPRNYYRNAQVGFWTGFIPQLHSNGHEDVAVPMVELIEDLCFMEHHFLPDHMRRDSFFGKIRHASAYHNDPFPPPPLPPTPPPTVKKTTTPLPSTPPAPSEAVIPEMRSGNYSTTLAVVVAIGVAMLMLNICLFFALNRQRRNNKKSNKKLQLQYQTYASNHSAVPEPYNNLNSPLTLMPPPPPPIGTGTHNHMNHSINEDSLLFDRSMFNGIQSGPGSLPRHSFQEQFQEPLLASSAPKTSVAGIRPGVSPTCPRHGRAAMAMHHHQHTSSRGNSLVPTAAGTPQPTLEEIQV